ncbi:DNA-binding response regulator [bacterium F11]|nr:DNA-binding response regulator [bacterium F11]
MKILIVEDDLKIAKFLQKGLKEEGYSTHWVKDGQAAYEAASREDWDLIILDIMLPLMDGISVCQKIRREGKTTPVLMLTARDSVENRVEGLDSGADDYLTKPFAFSELLARIRALSRRQPTSPSTDLDAGDLKVDLVAHKALYKGKEIELTSREFSLLQFFMRRKGHVLTRTILAESVWEYDFQSGTNIIDVYVNYLRKKLKKITGNEWIRTIRNRGYVFEELEN